MTTAVRPNTIKRGGARLYVSPETGEKYPGVTSILGMLPKDFLRYWGQKLVAEAAVEELGTLVGMVLRDPSAAVDHLKKAPDRFTRKAADTGSAAHDLFEKIARGQNIGRVHPDLEPYVRHFDDFLNTVKPNIQLMEETVWSDKHQYAGSFDAYGDVGGESLWFDWKTTRSGVHEEVALQLAAYGNAEFILGPDGSHLPVPKATGAAVLHVRPEGWKLVPTRYDSAVFDVFLHLREVFRYEHEQKRTMLGNPVFSGPAEDKPVASRRKAPTAKPIPEAVTA
jgi:hypothetical protein